MINKIRVLLTIAALLVLGVVVGLNMKYFQLEHRAKGWKDEKYPRYCKKMGLMGRYICGAPIIIYIVAQYIWRPESPTIKILKSEKGAYISV